MKKTVLYIFAVLVFISAFRMPSRALSVSAASAVLYDPLSESVLYEKDAYRKCGMASTTKIMTALVALENYDVYTKVEIKAEWCGAEGSSMYLKPGEMLTVLDLLYGLMLMSGNDAAQALSGICNGGSDEFILLMNEKAKALGLGSTCFKNPSGLAQDGHYSTAYDMARLTAYALENKIFSKIVSTREIHIAGRNMVNHNRLLWNCDGMIGVKTGYTKACGRCLVSASQRGGRTLIAVTLNAPDDWNDHSGLFEYGFSQYSEHELLTPGTIASVCVFSSLAHTIKLEIKNGFKCLINEKDKVKIVISGPRFCYAPVNRGEKYGVVKVYVNDKLVSEEDIMFCSSVDVQKSRSSFLSFLISKILSNKV